MQKDKEKNGDQRKRTRAKRSIKCNEDRKKRKKGQRGETKLKRMGEVLKERRMIIKKIGGVKESRKEKGDMKGLRGKKTEK